MLISPITPSSSAIRSVVARISSSISSPRLIGGHHAGRVAGVDAGLLDVLHDPGDADRLAVAERVDVDLDRVLEEAVEQQRVLLVGLDVGLQVGVEVLGRVADLHRPAAEHVGGPDQQREADLARRSPPPPRPRAPSRRAGA